VLATDCVLDQNHPNPFSSETIIAYTLPSEQHVSLTVYDVYGRAITTLVDGTHRAGRHVVEFHARELPPGTYICRLHAEGASLTRIMSLVK
jgi:hypothetical protein